MQGARAHDRSQVQAIRQRIDLFQDLALENTHSTGAVRNALATQHTDHVGEKPVPDPARGRHVAVSPRHAGTDHQIGTIQGMFA